MIVMGKNFLINGRKQKYLKRYFKNRLFTDDLYLIKGSPAKELSGSIETGFYEYAMQIDDYNKNLKEIV